MTRFRFLVPALFVALPAYAQQAPEITQMQQVNNGIASTTQFLGAMKSTIEVQSTMLSNLQTQLATVTKERDELKAKAEPEKK